MSRDENGLTLVELTLVVSILSIAMFMMFTFLDNATSTTRRASNVVRGDKDGQFALRTISEDIRGAVGITACPSQPWAGHPTWPSGFDNCVTFTVSRNTIGFSPTVGACPKSVITYALVGAQVLEDRTDYDAACVGRVKYSARPVVDSVVNSRSQVLFTYLDNTGAVISTSANPAAVPSADAVRVAVYLRYDSRAAAQAFTGVAALRNNNLR
jgi:Tfp pilus assembly protein PilW